MGITRFHHHHNHQLQAMFSFLFFVPVASSPRESNCQRAASIAILVSKVVIKYISSRSFNPRFAFLRMMIIMMMVMIITTLPFDTGWLEVFLLLKSQSGPDLNYSVSEDPLFRQRCWIITLRLHELAITAPKSALRWRRWRIWSWLLHFVNLGVHLKTPKPQRSSSLTCVFSKIASQNYIHSEPIIVHLH